MHISNISFPRLLTLKNKQHVSGMQSVNWIFFRTGIQSLTLNHGTQRECMRFLDLKTDGGQLKGKIAFYCSALGVSRQGFYWFLKHRDDPWKYADIADKMLENRTICSNETFVLKNHLKNVSPISLRFQRRMASSMFLPFLIVLTLEFWASLWQTICVQIFVHPQ